MPIRSAIWKVGTSPEALTESSLAKEQTLEDMIVAAPRLLSEEWMLVGRQEDTDSAAASISSRSRRTAGWC